MASGFINKTCMSCNVGLITAMCYECKKTFCTKHFVEHREELSQQMNNICQEHDILCRDLAHEFSTTHPLLAQINQWEQESTIKIQAAANAARIKLQQLLDRSKNSLDASTSKITKELESSRASNNYTEHVIKTWSDRLQELRTLLNHPTPIHIDYENNLESEIRLIKVTDESLTDLANSKSFYGWWDLAYYVVGGNKKKYDSTKTLRTGDELRFVLDCDNKQIILEHHRTNIILNLAIDIQLCVFPWKIIVLLLDKSSCVKILH
ncbi:unnamed protein product [Rotaria socialis]|uniref:Uncharacterized protein n=1 Tax=Rotaria socialis TaxID=392032 RepID=A0A820QFU3_9BILA|nr:unnamed protein product [Rotaria socialis]